MRLDRFFSLHVFAPLARPERMGGKRRIPILMYHSISARLNGSVHPYFETRTSPRNFGRQMQWLHETGCSVIGLSEVVGALSNEGTLPPKPVCLTFDDGFRDFLTEAFPILSKRRFPATVFLPTGYIGDERKTFKNRECLTWEEVRGLRSKGVVFGSHTVTHARLESLDGDELRSELQESKGRIEEETGAGVETFAYPFAFPEQNTGFVSKLKEAVSAAGYRCGVTTMIGRASAGNDPLFLRRIPVNDFDDAALFRAKLEGSYDWLHSLQRLSKFARKPLNVRSQKSYAA